ncbi:MAG: DUF4433 domain-containing protein [Calditrichaceae bacterium]|nr:DUF4433 domain-containing protein [Calditrichaceae bacterium]
MPEIEELHYITSIENISSIMKHGILCHNDVQKLDHIDISMDEVQQRRANKKVPNGLDLHDYANLYFDAHNPMLSKRRQQNSNLCILRIDNRVLNLEGVVLSDRNASSDYVRFSGYPDGLSNLDFETIFGPFWTSDDPFEYLSKKSIKCAEVLVPKLVNPAMITGAYVYSRTAGQKLIKAGFSLPITIKNSMFF